MNIIVAADQSWGIGKDNGLLVRIPQDMQRFRRMTAGKTVVMGRKTWESIPNPPLKGRRNIVLSADGGFNPKDAFVCRSESEVIEALNGTSEDEVFIIGGESVYRLFLPRCKTAYVTKVQLPGGILADRFFPNLDAEDGWKLAESSGWMETDGAKFIYVRYENIRI